MTPYKQLLLGFCKKEIVHYLKSNQHDIEEALGLAIGNDQPFSWRAAWVLGDVVEENDPRIKNHVKRIIGAISTSRDGQQRDLLRIVSFMDWDEQDEGNLFDICTRIWLSIARQPVTRYRALLTLHRIAKKHPELKNEIKTNTTQEYIETLSPGVKKAVFRMLSKL